MMEKRCASLGCAQEGALRTKKKRKERKEKGLFEAVLLPATGGCCPADRIVS
jgi:hypothetical protein